MERGGGEGGDAGQRDGARGKKRGGGEGDNTGQSDGAKAKKRVRDPAEPKKPLSSFMLFLAEMKDEVKREQPSLDSRDVSREVGRRWGLLEREEKEVYQKRYSDLLVAYKVDIAAYRVSKETETVADAAE